MSFNKVKEIIEEGDVVILYLGPSNMHSLEIKPKIINKKVWYQDTTFTWMGICVTTNARTLDFNSTS
ncbi:hypothetical protein ANTRET_LOCUS8472 [Anthophora retusa]